LKILAMVALIRIFLLITVKWNYFDKIGGMLEVKVVIWAIHFFTRLFIFFRRNNHYSDIKFAITNTALRCYFLFVSFLKRKSFIYKSYYLWNFPFQRSLGSILLKRIIFGIFIFFLQSVKGKSVLCFVKIVCYINNVLFIIYLFIPVKYGILLIDI
jgi:hypothetical protein